MMHLMKQAQGACYPCRWTSAAEACPIRALPFQLHSVALILYAVKSCGLHCREQAGECMPRHDASQLFSHLLTCMRPT